MKKFFRKLLLVLLIGFVLIIGITIAMAAIFEKQIGNRLVSELNKQITAELTVGDIDMSVLSTFPSVAANLKDVLLTDNREGVLLEAEQLSFRFGLLSFLKSSYLVKSVKISDGALNIIVDRNGRANYEIYESDTSEPTTKDNGKSPAVSLEEALLEDIEILYTDEQTEQYLNALVNNARFSGQFSATQFDLNSDAAIESRFLEMEGVRYLVGKEIGYDAQVSVDLEKGLYELQQVVANVGKNRFDVDGVVESRDNGNYYDLLLSNQQGSIEGVLQLLPEEYSKILGDFRSTGNFKFLAAVKGEHNKNETPEMRAELELVNGRLKSPRLQNDLRDVSFRAFFNNGEEHSMKASVFEITDLKGYFGRELTELQLRVEGLDDPYITFSLNGAFPLSSVYGLFNSPSITAGGGEIEIDKLLLKGRYSDMMRTNRINNVIAEGALEFDDASLTINEEEVIFDRGKLTLEANQMKVENLRIEGAGSDIAFDGQVFNLVPVLFSDSINSQNAELEFEAELVARQLDIDRLLTASNLKLEAQDTLGNKQEVVDSLKTATIQKREKLTNFLNGTFKTTVQEFNYYKIEGTDFTGLLSFDNNIMKIRGGTNAMKGVLDLDGELFFEEKPRLEAKVICKEIDIQEFFRQTENFGQDVLTNKNLSGALTSKMLIYGKWDEKGNFQQDDLQVFAGVGITDGELKELKLLEGFSTFVKIKDLKNIQFKNMQNFLEVRRSILYIPAMFIQSNAMNLTISGEHSFENEFNYNIKVNAGQVLANRFKSHDPSLRPLKARQKGFFNLHYKVYGNLDDYQYKSAKKQVKADFARSEKRRREIRNTLERAFGQLELIEEPAEWKDEEDIQNEADYLEFEIEGNGDDKKEESGNQ